MKREELKKSVVLAMLAALAFAVTLAVHFTLFTDYLTYDPKGVIITIAGFIFGPFAAALVSAVVCAVEMVTISASGPIGFLMNFLSACSFSCMAAYIYKRKHSVSGAVLGLVAGTLIMTALMLLWNYIITPLYTAAPREAVAAMLVPVILPFNLIKCVINSAVIMLLYKPVVTALRKSKLLPNKPVQSSKGRTLGVAAVSLVVLITCVFVVLAIKGMI